MPSDFLHSNTENLLCQQKSSTKYDKSAPFFNIFGIFSFHSPFHRELIDFFRAPCYNKNKPIAQSQERSRSHFSVRELQRALFSPLRAPPKFPFQAAFRGANPPLIRSRFYEFAAPQDTPESQPTKKRKTRIIIIYNFDMFRYYSTV